jgi:catechol 2,3-dioxygenase-like lactoylglutathione lyase family enzyme
VIAREAGFASWPKLRDELEFRAEVRRRHRLGSATGLETEMRNTMNTNESLKLGEIDQIGLSCTDLEAAGQFYGEVLGLRPCGDVPAVMKFFDCDGVRLVIFKADAVPPNSIIYFSAGREAGVIERKVALLKAKGVKVESDAHVVARNWNGCDVWLAFFRDPFGNLLGLKSDVPVG